MFLCITQGLHFIFAQAAVSWSSETLWKQPGSSFFLFQFHFLVKVERWFSGSTLFSSIPAALKWPFKVFSSWLVDYLSLVLCTFASCYHQTVWLFCRYLKPLVGLDSICHCWLESCKSSQLYLVFLNLKGDASGAMCPSFHKNPGWKRLIWPHINISGAAWRSWENPVIEETPVAYPTHAWRRGCHNE